MKKNYVLLLLMLLVIGKTNAQTLTSATNNPVIGETFTTHSSSHTGAGNSGTGQTWNFSTSASLGTTTVSFIAPSSAPNSGSFANANISILTGGNYSFMENTSTAQSILGYDVNGTIFTYSDPEDLIRFPFSYDSSYVDNFVADVNGFDRVGFSTVTADGTGTLILPYGTFNNVLRVKVVQDYSDSYNGSVYYEYLTEIYMWYLPNIHFYLYSQSSIITNGGTPSLSAAYLDPSHVTTNILEYNSSDIDLMLFPNPANNSTILSYSLSESSAVNIAILNTMGQIVKEEKIENHSSGVYNHNLDLNFLPKGIYFVQLEINGAVSTKKLIIN
ncbi:MAG: T9SS type A sorting domain-containing protein [Bacteroidota bacterium]|nr:T9SS type A sorting domain-containing protein [Bacteroidota bacterium]